MVTFKCIENITMRSITVLKLRNYIQQPKTQKILKTRPWEEGFSLIELVVVIAVLAILSAVAIPAFVGVQANARASAVKNGLVNGVKECAVRDSDNKSIDFTDAKSFSNANAFNGFSLSGVSSSCFAATASAKNTSQQSDFTIVMSSSTGDIVKQCSKSTLPGCNSNGTW